MSDEDALLGAIAAHPEEDTPRLVFADWLDEHGRHARAEFIRVQVAIAQKEHFPRAVLNRYVDLYRRNQELIDGHRAELLGPLAKLPADAEVQFHRGFAERIELDVSNFLTHSRALVTMRPLPGVCVVGILGRLASFLANPHTGCVTSIRGYAEEIDAEDLRYPDLSGLLDQIERMERLAVLDLEGCGVNDVHCAMALGFLPPPLHDLDLSNNEITDAGVDDLLRTDLPKQLTRLILGGNPLSDNAALMLAEQWPTGEDDRLEHLNLRFTPIGQAGQSALLRRFGGRVDLF